MSSTTTETTTPANGHSPAPSPSIQVTNKSNRSFSSTFLQASIRPLVSRMIKPKEVAPAGSPTIKPYDNIHKQCNIRQLEVEGIKLYEINSRSRSTRHLFASAEYSGWQPGEHQARLAAKEAQTYDLSLTQTESLVGEAVRTRDWAMNYDGQNRPRPRYIYYFPGGGWQTPASKEHWKLCAYLAHTLSQSGVPTTVYLVSYPLTPHCPAATTIPMLAKLYYTLFPAISEDLAQAETHDSYLSSRSTKYPEIIFAGDSSGANVALGVTLHVLSTDPHAPAPDSMMLISPVVDMRTTNPLIPGVAKKDPMLSLATIEKIHQAWCGTDMKEDDPRVSPTLADLSLFAKNNIVINGIFGTYDILAPDAILFVEKLNNGGIRGNWLVWEKQIHCFPLTFTYNVTEGKESVDWMIKVLSEERMQGLTEK